MNRLGICDPMETRAIRDLARLADEPARAELRLMAREVEADPKFIAEMSARLDVVLSTSLSKCDN